MRHKIGEHGIGNRDESWYYLLVNEDTGELFHVHEWHNSAYSGGADEGVRETPLGSARGLQYCGREGRTTRVAAVDRHQH